MYSDDDAELMILSDGVAGVKVVSLDFATAPRIVTKF